MTGRATEESGDRPRLFKYIGYLELLCGKEILLTIPRVLIVLVDLESISIKPELKRAERINKDEENS